MRVYLDNASDARAELRRLNLHSTAVALGRFDALHIGHLSIIEQVIDRASRSNIKSLIFMFDNSPGEVISGEKIKSVNTLEKRFEIVEKLGADIIVAARFDEKFMNITAEEFMENFIKDIFKAEYVAVGFNYKFGRRGRGTTEVLERFGAENDIEICVVPEVRYNDERVSSTRVRKCICGGDVDVAAEMMNRFFSVKGTVVEGNKIGASIGFPTANFQMPGEVILPEFGVYISMTRFRGKRYASITNVGGKPTVENDYQCIETHICGDFGDLYGEEIEVEFCRFIRGISKFNSLKELSEQLARDRELSKEFFRENKNKYNILEDKNED